MYHALISAVNHPDILNPYLGLFNFRSFKSLSATGVETDVVSPRPLAPPIGPYSEYREIPSDYNYGAYHVYYPRFAYLLPQKVFKYTLSSSSFARVLPEYIDNNFRRPDICHAGHIHYDGYGLLAYCKQNDLPLTVMGRGKILNNYDSLSIIAKQKIQKTLDYADRILCVSESLADKAETIVSEPKATVLANGADPSRYPTDCAARIRKELGVPPEATVILFCGGYTPRKGIHEIADALPQTQHENVHWVFVGHYGDLRKRLITALRESHHDSYRVLWEVSPLALRRWFAIADIFMLPSHAEGRPNTIYEAMASATPVVASAVSGIPEQVVDGETGLLIPPKDSGALADALNELIEKPPKRNRMGQNGLGRLEQQNWTWEAHGRQLREIHEEILEGS